MEQSKNDTAEVTSLMLGSTSFRNKFIQAYFDFVYNPAYDFTTGRLNGYRKLLSKCIDKLGLCANDAILCVGLGTGNELEYILKKSSGVRIVGVDLSRKALEIAYRKGRTISTQIETMVMDAKALTFPDNTFDKVVCIHVMDFVDEPEKATTEILRVLRKGGEFLITYPSTKEGRKLGANLLRENIRYRMGLGQNRARATLASIGQLVMGMVYLPILLRPNSKTYSAQALRDLISGFTSQFRIEEYPEYCDFIAHGSKSIPWGGSYD